MANVPDKPGSTAVAAFLDRLSRLPAATPAPGAVGRLVFAMDATASRQPSWDRACHLQAEMFGAVREIGGLAVSLAYFRGFREFAATPFLTNAPDLARRMTAVTCLGGQTQVERLLRHTLAETQRQKVNALVFIGDAFEEDVDAACHVAGELGLRGTPVFCFQEGENPLARNALRQVARLSGGAWAPFDAASATALRDLLRAVAVFAAGGRRALARLPGAAARGIAGQLPAPRGA
ncbi:VWA domain-containing protein [Falsiroseomonas selenitidurans]|uniref:VWA domain-containing protein n=1 Tax=Falsiroseomonas selenitidurans TaxID=2716335 RepID=A0ABX1DWQ5_9PROT|nr:VWA domain-containing protein [Falsiroseomonas selenitidurans]NKC29359.1 VWA domain-containing protein [Falsiroseomonas selenitidurans]